MTSYLVLCARVTVGAVLFAAVIGKTRGRRALGEFLAWLRALRVIPQRLTTAVAVTLMVAETAALVLLSFRVTAAFGLAFAAAMFAVFTVAIAWITHRGVVLPCRCFGASARPLGIAHVLRNLALALVAGCAAGAAYLGPWLEPPVSSVLAALLLGGAAALILIGLDDVIELFTPSRRTADQPR